MDSTTVALVGLITTAVAAVAAPVVTVIGTMFGQQRETRAAREDELRAVAEEAATALTMAIQHMDEARDAMRGRADPHMGTLHEDEHKLLLSEDRIGLRLRTTAPEYIRYTTAVAAWHRAFRGLGESEADLRFVKEARNTAQAESEQFKNAVAARLGPDASRRSRALAERAVKADLGRRSPPG